MTRDLLIKLLEQHQNERLTEIDDVDLFWCDACEKEYETYAEWAEHVADLILLGFAR
jgi:hypothetical protein